MGSVLDGGHIRDVNTKWSTAWSRSFTIREPLINLAMRVTWGVTDDMAVFLSIQRVLNTTLVGHQYKRTKGRKVYCDTRSATGKQISIYGININSSV